MKKSILIIAILALAKLAGAQCDDVFFSEYVEGSSQNKAVEIYNPTSQTIELDGYVIRRYKNGINTYDTELSLQGQSIAPYDVLVITNGQTVENDYGVVDPTLYGLGDMAGTGQHSTSPMYFNGNDAMTIEKKGADGVSYEVVDIFARVGSPDPENGWTDTTDITVSYNDNGTPTTYTIEDYIVGPLFWYSWTRDHTLIRKPTVTGGVTANPTAFMVHVEWDSIPKDTWDSLGAHSCVCNESMVTEAAPTVSTLNASGLSADGSATLNATVNANNAEATVTFEYGTSALYGTSVDATPASVSGSTTTNVSVSLSGLEVGTEYHYRVKATNSQGTTLGDDKTFTIDTSTAAPTIVSLSAIERTEDAAKLTATVNPRNQSTTVKFVYGTTSGSLTDTVDASPASISGISNTELTYQLSGLTNGATYYYNVIATNASGTTTGTESSFVAEPVASIGQLYQNSGTAIWPNPVYHGGFNVQSTDGIDQLAIYDMTGRQVYLNRMEGKSGLFFISTETLGLNGIYIIQIVTTGGQVTTDRIIVK